MKPILLYSLSLLFLSSCSNQSNKLTHEKATEIISAYYPTYCSNKRATKKVFEYPDSPMRQKAFNKKILNVFSTAEQTGLATIKVDGYNPTTHTIQLTEEASKKYGGVIPLTEYRFAEIVGISQNGNEATVKYNYEAVKTIFFDLQKTNEKARCWEGKWSKDVTLVKYDTGWKVK